MVHQFESLEVTLLNQLYQFLSLINEKLTWKPWFLCTMLIRVSFTFPFKQSWISCLAGKPSTNWYQLDMFNCLGVLMEGTSHVNCQCFPLLAACIPDISLLSPGHVAIEDHYVCMYVYMYIYIYEADKITYYPQWTWPKWVVPYRLWRFVLPCYVQK